MASAHVTEHIVDRDRHIIEHHRAGGRANNAHFVFFLADRKTRRVAFYHKGGEQGFIHFGKDGIEIRKGRIGNKVLGTIEDIMRPIR